MSYIHKCDQCNPPCILIAEDDDMPKVCPFRGSNPEKADSEAEWEMMT